jgi:hypothetical protein
MDKFTIALDANIVSRKTKSYQLPNQDGKVQATRKNPHVTNAGLRPSMQHSYWFITWMAIYTILKQKI